MNGSGRQRVLVADPRIASLARYHVVELDLMPGVWRYFTSEPARGKMCASDTSDDQAW